VLYQLSYPGGSAPFGSVALRMILDGDRGSATSPGPVPKL